MPEFFLLANSPLARDLDEHPTLAVGQCCDLKVEDANERWWLCRMPVGETDHRVTIENYHPDTGWITRITYKDPEC